MLSSLQCRKKRDFKILTSSLRNYYDTRTRFTVAEHDNTAANLRDGAKTDNIKNM